MKSKNLTKKVKNRTDMFDEITLKGVEQDAHLGVKIVRHISGTKKYSIINAPSLNLIGNTCAKHIEFLLKTELENTFNIKKFKNLLFVGLGNESITADALGGLVVKRLFLSKGLDLSCETAGICPSVQAKTGLETCDIIKAIINEFKPDLVVFIDTLASSAIARLGCSFQVNNVGISAGSGVGNVNKFMNKKFLGTPCLAVGVPFMIYSNSLLKMAQNKNEEDALSELILTPKNIDVQVNICAEIIANAFNRCMFPEFSESEIKNIMGY